MVGCHCALMHSVTKLDYLYYIADCLTAASTCDGSYSGIVVQLQQGDCMDAADVLQVFSLCILSNSSRDGYRCGWWH